jgi:DNA-binding transcriptional ArsR family regulator
MVDDMSQPVMIIELPEQLKAFTDPLRLQVLRILCRRRATNQQIADELNEPHAKVLYHIRFLLDVGLITLVDTQVKGGNVEKYYRAVARVFDLRGTEVLGEDGNIALATNMLDSLRVDFLSSAIKFPDYIAYIVNKGGWISPERFDEFRSKLEALYYEYWSDERPDSIPESAKIRFTYLTYQDPDTNTSEQP